MNTQHTPENQREQNSPRGLELEYTALREEILERLRTRHQLTLALAPGFTTIVPLIESYRSLAHVYPVIALFIAIAWIQNEERIGNAGQYIKRFIEPSIEGMGWERRKNQLPSRLDFVGWRAIRVAHLGFTVLSQIAILVLVWEHLECTGRDVWFVIIDAVTILLTCSLLQLSLNKPGQNLPQIQS